MLYVIISFSEYFNLKYAVNKINRQHMGLCGKWHFLYVDIFYRA